jgi:hypothetical protein
MEKGIVIRKGHRESSDSHKQASSQVIKANRVDLLELFALDNSGESRALYLRGTTRTYHKD